MATPQPAQAPAREATLLERFGFPAVLFVLSAAVSPISQLTIAPIYGAIPSAIYHGYALIFACAIAFGSYIVDGSPTRSQHIWIAVFPFWTPVLQYILLPASKALGPVTGAIFNGAVSCHAVLVPSMYAFAEALSVFDLKPYVGPYAGDTVKAALIVPAFLGMEKKVAGWISDLLSASSVLTPVHLQLALASCYAVYFPSWYLLLALPGLLHTVILNPHMSPALVNQALGPHNWTLVDRQWSTTGYISVLDSMDEHYRVLRCDHSLLGGEWLLTEERKQKEGWKSNEPIYAVFEMLEAVRLMQFDTVIPDNEAQALVIGLGIGTAPKALMAHGIDTTVVEIDPVVHAFATQYFDLPPNHTAILQDAVSWVGESAAKGEKKYDYIIHDVFTGGAEPIALFNADFLGHLRSLLKPRGAIALNYAGDLVNPLTRSVLHTIDTVFTGQSRCKIFRDGPPEKHLAEEGSQDDFMNMVVFCKNSDDQEDDGGSDKVGAGSQAGAVAFRTPRQADFLGSKSREHYMLPKPELEIPFPDPSDDPSKYGATPPPSEPIFKSLLAPLRALRDPWTYMQETPKVHTPEPYTQTEVNVIELGDEKKFTTQQEEGATRHWFIMRTVLPDAVWEFW